MPASTLPLSRTIALTSGFLRNAPLIFLTTNPPSNDPAFANADWVRQFMLAAPFAWSWNRAKATFTCDQVGTQDYSLSLADFGWLEKATCVDLSQSTNPTKELSIELNLADESQQGTPTRISAEMDDGNGNITFRLHPAPDAPYIVNLTYQKRAGLFVNTTDTWAPIPDSLSYLVNQGMLAKCAEYLNDSRAGEAMVLFLRQVVAANSGLDETQVNIFLQDHLNTLRQSQESVGNAASGRQGRGAF